MDNQDYLTNYRHFFDGIYSSLSSDHSLPVHIGKYNVAEFEIMGEVIRWCLEYLNNWDCPPSLIAPLCRSVISELEEVIRKDPEACGYRPKEDDYQTLRLMQFTIKKLLYEVVSRYRDNSEVSRLPPPPPVSPSVSTSAVKNGRRTMEDCHIVIHDLHALFGIEGYGVASYYAVFDGHNGSDAAIYACSHIHQYLVESKHYPKNPEAAFKEAFIKTDEKFIDKSNKMKSLKSGTTAICILIRHDLGKMYVAWIGDSQAILVNGREFIQLVKPHRPDQLEEKERIEAMGGSVVFWGTWRVNGQLAVSRAIGDVDYKPYVTAEPDVTSHELTGDEDFLILACDGLWDVYPEALALSAVYDYLDENYGDREKVALNLVRKAKYLGSKDNITVVVAWLDMSSLENGHFVPDMEVADDLLPPVLRSLKPAVQTITPPAPQRLDKSAEQWLKTLPWSYADALRKPAPKKEEPPPVPSRDPVPPPQPENGDAKPEVTEDVKVEEDKPKDEEALVSVEDKVPKTQEEPTPPTTKGEDTGDVVGEGESGDDSDEEWNYISGKQNRQSNQHAKRELTQEEMESQLNPNAAEFVPGFGPKSPISDLDIADISRSPSKRSEIKNLDNVVVPSQNEFYNEISKRPSEIDDFGDNDSTVNGGDLTDISTKAVFGDDSVCLTSTMDSSIVQNEPLKSTNPFASSQVPNFVQDHFSAPEEDSKNTAEYDLMSSSGKPESEVLSPSAPSQEAYSSGQNDLSGITFGDGFNVDNVVRSKQDSPLLRESPEPSLLNGRHDNELNESTPDLESNQRHEVQPEESEVIEVENIPKTSQVLNNELNNDSAVTLEAPEGTSDVVFHSDHGPETSVDSESEDDVLVSPKIKEREFAANMNIINEVVASEDPVCSLNRPQDNESAEKSSELGIELEEEHVFHKDEEDEIISHVDNTSKLPSEVAFIPESGLSDELKSKPEGIFSDFEIVHKNEQNLEKEVCNLGSEEVKNTIDLSPQPVEEIISKEEVHEDLICPIKEIPLLHDKLPEASEIDNALFDADGDSRINSVNVGSASGFGDDHHLENGLESGKQNEEVLFSWKQEHQQQQDKNFDEVLITSTETNDIMCSLKKDDLPLESKNMFNTIDFETVSFNKNVTIGNNPGEVEQVFQQNDNSVCQLETEELVCPIKKGDVSLDENYDFVCQIKKENINSSFVENIEDSSKILQNGEDAFGLLKEEPSSMLIKENEVVNEMLINDSTEAGQAKEDEVHHLMSEDSNRDQPPKEDAVSIPEKDMFSLSKDEDICNREDEICSLPLDKNIELLPEVTERTFSSNIEENALVDNSAEGISEPSFELHQSTGVDVDIFPVKPDAGHASAEDSVLTPEKTTESLLDNLEQSREEKIHQEESIDEMSSSMIDHGEDKCLPEPQTNQLDIIQDLQFDVNEKAEEKADADTESDSGFEIINASEASTIEMEMKIQSEKEAGAVDEKLHLDKNEAEMGEKVESEIVSRLETVVENEVLKSPELDIAKATEAVLNGSVTPPATPPATPAPGLQVENKEGLIAAAVAAAGVATAVVAGTAAVAVAESKEEKKPDALPKKAEPVVKAAPGKMAAAKPTAKPSAPSKAPAPKAPASSNKTPAKPPSPISKSSATAKPTGASKPALAAAKAAPKAPSKPSTPTSARAPPTAAAAKSKPTMSAPTKPAPSAAAKPAAAKPSTTAAKPSATSAKPPAGAARPSPATSTAKKPTPAPASKPPTTVSKTTVSSTTARPASKATPATSSKPAVSSTLKSPSGPKPPSKPSTPTGPKAAAPSARPPSAKSSVGSKPAAPSAATKAPAKPSAPKAPASKPPVSTNTAAKTTAAKPTPGKTAAPAKTAPTPINKKPAAPTAIKKPTAPTDKSVKEANNKLASSKTAIKKVVDDKKIINKKEDIIEIDVPLTQEPIVTTTNGHISLIENGIPSPEIAAEVN